MTPLLRVLAEEGLLPTELLERLLGVLLGLLAGVYFCVSCWVRLEVR